MAEEDEKKKPVPPLPPSGFATRPSGFAAPKPPPPPSLSSAPSGLASKPPAAPAPSLSKPPLSPAPSSAPSSAQSPARPPLSAPFQSQAPPAPKQFGGSGLGAPPAPPRQFSPSLPSSPISLSLGGSNLPTILSGFALLLSVIALVAILLGAGGGVSKPDAKAIAEELEKLGEKEITITAPVDTTLKIDRSFDAADAFPKNLTVPVDSSLTVPEGTTLTVLSPTGQPTPFKILDKAIPVRVTMTLDLEKAAAGKQISIKKDVPAQVEMTAKIKIKDLYGEEYKKIIERLKK